jgi:hypothetical protein
VKGTSAITGGTAGAVIGTLGLNSGTTEGNVISNNLYGYNVKVTMGSTTYKDYTKRGISKTSGLTDVETGAMLEVYPASITGGTSANGSKLVFAENTVGSNVYKIDETSTPATYYYAPGQTITLTPTLGSRTETSDIRTFYDELTALTMSDGTNSTDIKDALSFTMPSAAATVSATIAETYFTIPSNQKQWMSFCQNWGQYEVSDAAATSPKTIAVSTISSVNTTTGEYTSANLSGVSFSGVPTLFSCEGGLPEKLKFTPVTGKTAPTYDSHFKGVAAATVLSGNAIYVMNGEGNFNRADLHEGLSDAQKTLAAHKCYIDLSGTGASARLMTIVRSGETTSVNEKVTVNSANATWYTLDGRKLDKQPTKKGLYIYNGKKIAIMQ